MATQLNIKDPVLVQRVRELAFRKGQPITATLRDLVDREWQARESEQAERLARMTAFTRELQASVPEGLRNLTSKEFLDSIYDDNEPDGFAR